MFNSKEEVYSHHHYDAEERMALELWERRLRRIIGQKTISNIITLPKTSTAA